MTVKAEAIQCQFSANSASWIMLESFSEVSTLTVTIARLDIGFGYTYQKALEIVGFYQSTER